MKENWPRAIGSVLRWEGGYAARENEPGGHVNKGISLATFREKYPDATVEDLKAITDEQAAEFYRNYASGIHFDDLPGGLDVVVLHAAVMQGVHGAEMLLDASSKDGTPLERAGEVLIRQMHKKMHDKNVGTFGPGWSDRFVAVYDIAKELAK